ncbi:MAG TPA: TetR/AcrR family transcriptional regulator [Candidatus Dormibacteraeota bacterium]|nr:TetR/AcrR family transcriptional regulator [Candidatus Dormibacteraeota bacterium]
MKTAAGEPVASTRGRILEAALDLFTELGFDKTSLRQVSERVGVTKAALYYHFQSKEEILSTLIERVHGIGHHGLDVLPALDGPVDLATVMGACEQLLEHVLSQRKVFMLIERNRTAVDALGARDPEHRAEHEKLEQQWSGFAANPKISLRDRVRVLAALGALMAGAVGATRGLGANAEAGLKDELVGVLRDVLGVPQPALPSTRLAQPAPAPLADAPSPPITASGARRGASRG